MKSIVFFNNKGGVGKTTLSCNIAAYLSIHGKKRVLFIDADPQCNATQLICNDSLSEALYLSEERKDSTLLSVLKHIDAGDSSINENISPIVQDENDFKVSLIASHPRLSLSEDRFSTGWKDHLAGDLGGARVTNWFHRLLQLYKDDFDLIIIDVGPSLGALNRCIILGCNFVFVPMGCDIFSLIGIDNISTWLSTWLSDYQIGMTHLAKKTDRISEFGIIEDASQQARLAGYSIQQYVSKQFQGGPRPVKAYDKIMQEIPSVVKDRLEFMMPDNIEASKLSLGHVPYLYSSVPLSQTAHKPIFDLKGSDGIAGSQHKQVRTYQELMGSLCTNLLTNIGEAIV